MAPLRGWGDRGKRLITHVPYGHWPTMTSMGALRHDGIEAPWVQRHANPRFQMVFLLGGQKPQVKCGEFPIHFGTISPDH
jgi:hypothetical protein